MTLAILVAALVALAVVVVWGLGQRSAAKHGRAEKEAQRRSAERAWALIEDGKPRIRIRRKPVDVIVRSSSGPVFTFAEPGPFTTITTTQNRPAPPRKRKAPSLQGSRRTKKKAVRRG